ncbi:ferritin-like domain-containing protein [Rhodovibrionaceae bacterium A322]
MAAKHWTPDDVAWDRFDPSKVTPDVMKMIKAAALVEYNGDDYAEYLTSIFADDPEFCALSQEWAKEEVQHGEVLGRWAKLADPAFDLEVAAKRFRSVYRVDTSADRSLRGSLSAELVARCIVEVGTSSYYGSLKESTEEPVLQEICQRIAADELRHYKLFYTHLQRYLTKEKVGKLRRTIIAFGRIVETEDDELAYAYWAANAEPDAEYDRKKWSNAYLGRAYGFYRQKYVDRATAMTCKAAGLDPQGRFSKFAAKQMFRIIKSRHRKLQASGALAA